MIESLLLAVTRVTTLFGQQRLTNATGFFFARDGRLFLVTNRHVVLDEASGHRPDRLEIELHVAPGNVAATAQFSIPLYRNEYRSGGRDATPAARSTSSPWSSSVRPCRRRCSRTRLRPLTWWSSSIRSKWERRY